MKKTIGLLSVLVVAAGCATVDKKPAPNCGALNGTLLESITATNIGPADAESVNTLLTQFNFGKKWDSSWGARVVAIPSLAVYDPTRKEYCRDVEVDVDGNKSVIHSCLTTGSRWVAVPANNAAMNQAPAIAEPQLSSSYKELVQPASAPAPRPAKPAAAVVKAPAKAKTKK